MPRKYLESSRRAIRKYNKKIRAERKAKGECVQCKLPALTNRVRCESCLLKVGCLTKGYKITLESKKALYVAQGGLCAICRRTPTGRDKRSETLHVDHDHATGKIRGLLCINCNQGLGSFKDDRELLEMAVKYLDTSASDN